MTKAWTVDEVAERVQRGVAGAVARAITWVESGGERAEALLALMPARQAHVIGITGAPGAGKSTLVSQLVQAYRGNEITVGVVAVDPSSPLTGGALLGDRVRLEGVTGDRGVFFRSLASRGAAGGLSDAARAAATILSAAGFDLVLVETIGAGQAEVEIMRVADTVAVVLNPGAGDDVQALKAGLMEIADIYVLNKADRAGIGNLKAQIAGLLHVRQHTDSWRPPLVETVANEGKGITELMEAFDRHEQHLAHGLGAERAHAGARAEALRVARSLFDQAVAAEQQDVLARLDGGELDEVAAGRRLAALAGRRLIAGPATGTTHARRRDSSG